MVIGEHEEFMDMIMNSRIWIHKMVFRENYNRVMDEVVRRL